jgi:hypothetical protein
MIQPGGMVQVSEPDWFVVKSVTGDDVEILVQGDVRVVKRSEITASSHINGVLTMKAISFVRADAWTDAHRDAYDLGYANRGNKPETGKKAPGFVP